MTALGDLGADAWLTLVVLAGLCWVFVTERISPTTAMGGAVVVLYLAGVIDADQAFGGFANIAPITVAALYVLAGAADLTGALGGLSSRLLGPPGAGGERRQLSRVVFPTTLLSGFVPNTPVVAMFAPRVAAWARKGGRSPSLYLLPLSYAAILGGVVTVLGTSTNLVVSGLLRDAGEGTLSVFEITPVGLPLAVVGGLVLVATAPWLLSERRAGEPPADSVREFTIELVVPDGSERIGEAVGDVVLPGVQLVELVREGRPIVPVPPEVTLAAGDRLVYAGEVDRAIDLQTVPGLDLASGRRLAVDPAIAQRFFEVVVSENSTLSGTTLKQAQFQQNFEAVVVAIHRADARLSGQLDELPLRTGDVLLVAAAEGFRARARQRSEFSVVAPYEAATPLRKGSARLVEAVTLAMVVLATTGVLDLTRAAVGAVLVLLGLRVLTPTEARRSINLNIIVMIAFSFGLGAAVSSSGLAAEAASGLVSLTSQWGDLGIVLGIALATLVATELLTNNAAAAVMFPVAAATAVEAGVDVRSLAIVILLMASCSFLTPIGYQTNTMVFGMGGYRVTDFTRVGLPLTLTTLVLTVVLVPVAFPL